MVALPALVISLSTTLMTLTANTSHIINKKVPWMRIVTEAINTHELVKNHIRMTESTDFKNLDDIF